VNGRRYSIEILTWGRTIYDAFPAAWETIRSMLSLPSECLLRTKFAEERWMISDALQNETEMWRLIQLWESTNPYSAQDRRIILVVDVVSCRPMVTVSEDGFLTVIGDMERLEDIDLLPGSLPALLPSRNFSLLIGTASIRPFCFSSSADQSESVLRGHPCCLPRQVEKEMPMW
jgi:hypothetical protein